MVTPERWQNTCMADVTLNNSNVERKVFRNYEVTPEAIDAYAYGVVTQLNMRGIPYSEFVKRLEWHVLNSEVRIP